MRKLNNHQLNFKQFISKKGDFIFTGGSFELNSVDKEFIDCLYDQFFETDLFSSSDEENNIINIKKCIKDDEYKYTFDKNLLPPIVKCDRTGIQYVNKIDGIFNHNKYL